MMEKEKVKVRKKIRLGISLGDIGGIGPEIAIQAFQEQVLREAFSPIIYGSPKALNFYRKILSVEKFSYNIITQADQAQTRKVSVIDCGTRIDQSFEIGMPTQLGGEAAFNALNRAVADLKSGQIDALVTLPLDKSTIQIPDQKFTGHTEFLANAFDVKDYLMFMISDHLNVGVVTGHIPLKEVSAAITSQKILTKLRLMNQSLRMDFTLQKPAIAVLGLNPHAGDNGLLGTEDQSIIAKAIKDAEAENIFAFGPFSPDGFFASGQFRRFDGILAMYHDQGLIPFKLLAAYSGVNYTAGLPIIRTSPDHGVAYDLAGKNEASIESFVNALYSAENIFKNRFDNEALLKGSIRNKGVRIPVEEEGEVMLDES